MFSKRDMRNEEFKMINKDMPFTVIASDVTIVGNITAKADLHVDGCIEGDVVCASLIQGPESQITGKIQTSNARLSGTIDGSIDVEELVIEGTAKIKGDVKYSNIRIEAGASLDSRFLHAPSTSKNLKLVQAHIHSLDEESLG